MVVMTLKAARVNANLTVKEAAEKIGITEDTLYRYENGKSSPKIETAKTMASVYGISIDSIDFSANTSSEKTNK